MWNDQGAELRRRPRTEPDFFHQEIYKKRQNHQRQLKRGNQCIWKETRRLWFLKDKWRYFIKVVDNLLQVGQDKIGTENWTGFTSEEVTVILGKNSLGGVVVLQTRLDLVWEKWEGGKKRQLVLLQRKERKAAAGIAEGWYAETLRLLVRWELYDDDDDDD